MKGIEVNSKRSVPNDRTDALCVKSAFLILDLLAFLFSLGGRHSFSVSSKSTFSRTLTVPFQ